MPIVIKRAYDAPKAADGFRVLVDRLWPRGVSKQNLKLDAWMRDLAPSTELRRWFHDDMTPVGGIQETLLPGAEGACRSGRGT